MLLTWKKGGKTNGDKTTHNMIKYIFEGYVTKNYFQINFTNLVFYT